MNTHDNPFAVAPYAPADKGSNLAKLIGIWKERGNRPMFSLPDAQWLRAQRAGIRGEVELQLFQAKLRSGAESFSKNSGHNVSKAVALTLGALAVAAVGIALGLVIMNVAGGAFISMMES